METKIIEDLGFSKREAKLYLALLELGSSTIGNIIKKTEIPSSKIYEVLNKLIEKGLVSYVIKKHQKHFQAADPNMVLNEINERKNKFEEILPILKEKQKLAKDRQEIELYEGKTAIINLIWSLIDKAKKGDEYLSFSVGIEHDDPEISLFYNNLIQRRKAKGLKIKVLTNEKIKSIYEKRYDKRSLSIINNRYTKFNFPQGIIILNDKLIILNWKDKPTAILIISKNLTKQFRLFFYELYNNAK